jgi:hypothetical protein
LLPDYGEADDLVYHDELQPEEQMERTPPTLVLGVLD